MASFSRLVFVACFLLGAAEPPGCVDLDSGHAFKDNNVNSWPCVKVSRGAGTWTNIPRFENLLGKTLKYTVDLSAVGCRNVVAFQMVDSLHAGGQYCDGQSADPCVEIDFMEANEHVWGTTIHSDGFPGGWKAGIAKGYGGDRSGMWNYGVDGVNVNTKVPIDVNLGFPVDSNGILQHIFVALYQNGDTSPKATFVVGENNYDGLKRVTDAIRRGMAPGFSYWNTDTGGVSWFDGPNCHYWYPGLPAYFYGWQIDNNLEFMQGRNATDMII